MPDFVSPSESNHPDLPVYAPAEDIPEGVPADALSTDDDAADNGTSEAEETIAPAAPLTADRALNIAFGAALLLTDAAKTAAQKLGEQAEFVQNNAPAVWDALEEKGKPAREALMEKLREAVRFTPADDDSNDGGDLPNTSGGVDASQELPLPAGEETAAPFVPTVSASGGSAEAEISALERRVRELEQEVSKPLVVNTPNAEPQPQPVGESDNLPFEADADDNSGGDAGGESETTAEFSTYDFSPDAPGALVDSPYAVSETPEETTSETTGESNEAAPGDSHTPASDANGESNQA